MTSFSAIDQSMMSLALQEARKALYLSNPNPRVGCVIAKNDRILGKGFTQKVGSNHAEIEAIADTKRNGITEQELEGSTLYVTLEPCAMCAGAMLQARIDRLVYGAPDPKTGVIDSHIQLFQQPVSLFKIETTGGILAQECGQLLRNFFQEKRRKCHSRTY